MLQKCALCGRVLASNMITEQIGGRSYTFDKEGCMLLFKRFKSVYGDDFLTD